MTSTPERDEAAEGVSTTTAALARYIARAHHRELPAHVVAKSRLHVLDTVAAMVSGSYLAPGRRGADFARAQGPGPAGVIGAGLTSTPAAAALANGMAAHADETDDSHPASLSHPGCGVVPAALAAGERLAASGQRLLTAVATGYDAGTRVAMALGRPPVLAEGSSYSTHAITGQFGAAAAVCSLYGLTEQQVRWALSYTAQSAGGVTSWLRDPDHVEKAYVFGGMPASNGVRAVELVAAGCDGVGDVFSGTPNYLDALSPRADRDRLADVLGERYEIMHTNIKKFAVGSPAQAAVQATLDIIGEHGVTAQRTASVDISLPRDLCRVVDERDMPDVNVQYLVAGTLTDQRFTFAMAHDSARMHDPLIRTLRERTRLHEDDQAGDARSATVVVTTSDGQQLSRHVSAVRGSVADPMSEPEVEAKAADLMEPVLGRARTGELLRALSALQGMPDVNELRRLLY